MAILVGLTGGMGSGKSTVANLFKNLGAHVIDADQVCRDLVQPGQPALEEIKNAFGPQVLSPEGGLDRKKMAQLVFSDSEKKRILEGILHPKVFEEEHKRFQAIKHSQPDAVVIIDAALLIESGNYRKVDKVVLVECDEACQMERIVAKGQFEREDVLKRIRSQMPQKEKSKFADFVLKNDSSLEELETKVSTLYSDLHASGKKMIS